MEKQKKWEKAPKFKLYESLGVLADKDRLEVVSDDGDVITAHIHSSSRNKFYTVTYASKNKEIMSNDNATWFVGYLGYPASSLLLYLGEIKYDKSILPFLDEIPWKDINQKNKNDFGKTQADVEAIYTSKGGDVKILTKEIDKIYKQLENLDLYQLGKKQRPPKGY